MATVVVLGAGIAGHTAAMTLRHHLNKKHEVIVVSPAAYFQWIPSNIWVGIGKMTKDDIRFRLAEVYAKKKITYYQAKAVSIHPEGNSTQPKGFVRAVSTAKDNSGEMTEIAYDFLINATGPKLDFGATQGLGPDNGHTHSVCSYTHAEQANQAFQEAIAKMEAGEKQRFLVGVGHPTATCQGAAFEYALNLSFEIKSRGLDDLAEITWISNEYELGDFGMGGAYIKRGGYVTPTKVFTESIFTEYGIRWIKRAGVYDVEPGKVHYETLDGEKKSESFDFAMLIPAFSGVDLKAFDKTDADITDKLFVPDSGFMKVDANYDAKPFKDWLAEDWPMNYQNPDYSNIFAVGISFAPPHPISKPMESPNGTQIFAAPPRTGMPSGVMGKIVAKNIVHRIKKGTNDNIHSASMARMGAACVVSAGFGLMRGRAATLTVYPVVPDWHRFPKWGRNILYTVGESGLAGHWIKMVLHYMFLYKAKGGPLWWMIPE
ncbi:MAG: FAD-dependent oxidoreductase [Desulfobacteraceae bacterium]|jgi:sulfide:quinone oxidoreductase